MPSTHLHAIMDAREGTTTIRAGARVVAVLRLTPDAAIAALLDPMEALIRAYANAFPRYGYRRLQALLSGEGVHVGAHTIRRVKAAMVRRTPPG